MKGRILLGGILIAAMLAFIVIAAVVRARRSAETVMTAPVETPKSKAPELRPPPAPLEPEARPVKAEIKPEKQGAALYDATLLGLIQNAKVAQQRGDLRTRDAMLTGLKKKPERSRELLQKEIASAKDRTAVYALETLMQELQ